MGKAPRIIIVAPFAQPLDHLDSRVVLLAVFLFAFAHDHLAQLHSGGHHVNEHNIPLPRLDVHLTGSVAHGSDAQLGEV